MKILFYGNCQCLCMSHLIVDTDDVKTYGLECFNKMALRKEYVLSKYYPPSNFANIIVHDEQHNQSGRETSSNAFCPK